jgi:hypothetical protein
VFADIGFVIQPQANLDPTATAMQRMNDLLVPDEVGKTRKNGEHFITRQIADHISALHPLYQGRNEKGPSRVFADSTGAFIQNP